MYNYLYDGKQHTDTSTDYLTKLGMDEENIESLQRDANEYEEQQLAALILQRNGFLNDSDWIVLRHKDQLDLGITTTLSDSSFKFTLQWRQQLRDMLDSGNATYSKAITWPPFPPFLEDVFPDYPPDR